MAFAKLGPNSRFLRDFIAQNGAFVQAFVSVFYFFGQSDEKFRGRDAKFQAPEFLFRGSEFLFRGSDGKIPVQKSFRGGFGTVFLSRWNFSRTRFPCHFVGGIPGGLSRQPGFCAGSVPCSVKRTGLEGISRHFDFRMARMAVFFPRRPGPAAGYANLRRRK